LSEVLHPLEKIVDGIKEKRIKIMDELEFNIGGTGL